MEIADLALDKCSLCTGASCYRSGEDIHLGMERYGDLRHIRSSLPIDRSADRHRSVRIWSECTERTSKINRLNKKFIIHTGYCIPNQRGHDSYWFFFFLVRCWAVWKKVWHARRFLKIILLKINQHVYK